jgi:hypothetical protein
MVINDRNIWPVVLNPFDNFLERTLGMPFVCADQGTANGSSLPDIMVIGFSYGNIELSVQPIKQWFYPSPFLF